MPLPWQNAEEQNYICMRKIVTDIVSKNLRTIFTQEWNNRWQATLGSWDNTATSGQMLFNMENRRPSARNYLDKYKKGDINEWDCTVLFDAILYSKSIGKAGLNPTIKAEVDNLRKLRNQVIHAPNGKLPEHEFEDKSEKVRKSFLALGFPTEEIDDIKMERKRVTSFQQFQVLPQHPTHKLISRDDEVSTIIDGLNNLRTSNTGKLTYFYISGNPGSGKSQLARQIGESYYSEEMKKQTGLTFVMTLNAKNPKSLLQSYEDFARRLNCTETVVASILNSNQTTEVKIRQLRIQIATRIKNYTSWLIIVDNVEELKLMSSLLPELGSQEWKDGQVLVTTQDTSHIPQNGSVSQHVSLSPGMELRVSCHLLATVSGTGEHPMLEEVANVLDNQPLALAAAAVYLKQVKESVAPEFSWNNYLQKLNEGKLRLTEQQLRDTNPAYSQTMTTAVLLAVEKAADSDNILHHTFRFLSMASHESLPLEIVIKYVLLAVKDQDREQVGVKIRNSSLILSDECKNVFIRLHRVVHDAAKTYVKDTQMDDVVSSFNFAVQSFCRIDKNEEKHLVPHLRALYVAMKRTFPNCKTLYPVKANTNIWQQLSYFGRVLCRCGEFGISKIFQTAALAICKQQEEPDQVQIAVLYRHLGNVHQALGALHRAEEYYKSAKHIFIKQLQPDHVNVASTYGCLGNVNHALGKLKKAKHLQKRALNILTKQLGADHPDVAIACTNLGNVYKDLGDLKQAKDYHERALAIRKKKLGPNHAEFLIVYVNLASVHADMGDLQKAKEYYELALDIGEKQLGSDHVNVAIVYTNLANVYKYLGDLQQTRDYHERALAIRMKQFGPNHAEVLTCYKDLGNVNRELGDPHQARFYYKRARYIQTKRYARD